MGGYGRVRDSFYFFYREGLEGFRIFHLVSTIWVYFGLFYFGSILSHNSNY